MSEDFNPYQADRAPRSEGYKEETEELFELIQEHRGDERIGQFIINAVRFSERFDEIRENSSEKWQYTAEQMIWAMDAPELLSMVKDHIERRERNSTS